MRVEQLMNQPIITCDETDSLNEAAKLMWDHDIGALAVVDGNGRLTGVITDRDICMAAYTQGRRLTSIGVARVMAAHVVSCRREEPVAEAQRRMVEHKIRRLPVVDDEGHPIGILTLSDVAQAAAKDANGSSAARRLLEAFAAVSTPRDRALTPRT
jgi:CBS-domain-containing membrane protein